MSTDDAPRSLVAAAFERDLVVDRLLKASDDDLLRARGFHDDDRADVRLAMAAALDDPERLDEIGALAGRLAAAIGDFTGADPFPPDDSNEHWRGIGVVPLLALLVVADDVVAFHRSRGIPDDISTRTLSDIGQQAWVHRRTYGAFGLHTYGWLRIAYSGALYWLGRLQFNLTPVHDGWALSTHIPETGPLTPAAVQDSLRQAVDFFALHFPDYPTSQVQCDSWLLDPQLAEVLDAESNMVRFQRIWTLEGEPRLGDTDALFFVFRVRADVDRSTLPRDTTLQRAVLDRLDAGGHWYLRRGTLEQAAIGHAENEEEE